MNKFRVMCNVNGYAETHTDDFDTREEAEDLKDRLNEYWGENEYFVESYVPEPYVEPRQYNNNAVDGWEDMHPNTNED
jgi:hypothetical protein